MFGPEVIKSINSETHKGHKKIHTSVMYPVKYEWECPDSECTGFMESTGQSVPSQDGLKRLHLHKCNHCEQLLNLEDDHYPRIEFKELK